MAPLHEKHEKHLKVLQKCLGPEHYFWFAMWVVEVVTICFDKLKLQVTCCVCLELCSETAIQRKKAATLPEWLQDFGVLSSRRRKRPLAYLSGNYCQSAYVEKWTRIRGRTWVCYITDQYSLGCAMLNLPLYLFSFVCLSTYCLNNIKYSQVRWPVFCTQNSWF